MRKNIMILAVLALAGTACMKEVPEHSIESKEEQTLATKLVGGSQGEIIPGSVLVKLDARTTEKILGGGFAEVSEGLFGDIAVKSFTPALPIMPKNIEVAKKYGLDRWFNVEFDEEIKPETMARRLAASSAVRSVQYNKRQEAIVSEQVFPCENFPMTKAGTGDMPFNDPYSVHQWNLHNDGTLDEDAAAGADAGVKDAWRLTGGDPSVIVAVLDRGIAVRHDDLKKAMWVNKAELTQKDAEDLGIDASGCNGTAGVDDDGNGFIDDKYGFNFVECSMFSTDYVNGKVDLEGSLEGGPNPAVSSKPISSTVGTSHGTHVAGIIAATNNNGTGISSIAGGTGNGDGVRLMSCQVDNGAGRFASDTKMAMAYIYAADNGACIAQCSFGEPTEIMNDDAYTNGSGNDWEGAPLHVAALRYFLDEGNSNHSSLKGNIAVYAAGNDNWAHARYPGAFPNVISVSAVGYDMLPTGYTNYGAGCKIAAPGGEIRKIGEKLYHPSMILSTGSYHDLAEQPGLNTGTEERPNYSQNYVYMYGTSMACPHVSGVIALGISYAHKLGRTYTREEMTSMLLTSVNDIDQYLVNGTKHGSYRSSTKEFVDLTLNEYYRKMGTGLVDAWKFLMAVEGTPSVIVRAGADASVDLADWCNPSGTYTISVDDASKASLGLSENPVIKNGKLQIKCGKVGAGKIMLSSSVGKDEAVEGGIGSMDYSRTISIVSREFATNNGGWL